MRLRVFHPVTVHASVSAGQGALATSIASTIAAAAVAAAVTAAASTTVVASAYAAALRDRLARHGQQLCRQWLLCPHVFRM